MAIMTVVDEAVPGPAFRRLRDVAELVTAPERVDFPYGWTFWHELGTAPTNAVAAVAECLRVHLPAEAAAEVVGVEWWLGRLVPPYAENFPFRAHRDVGQHPDSGEEAHPRLSAVLYLTSNAEGPLVVFADEPRLDAGRWEHHLPRANSLVMFPGDRWHSVSTRARLGDHAPIGPDGGLRLTVQLNWWAFRPSADWETAELSAGDYRGQVYPELGEGFAPAPTARHGV